MRIKTVTKSGCPDEIFFQVFVINTITFFDLVFKKNNEVVLSLPGIKEDIIVGNV